VSPLLFEPNSRFILFSSVLGCFPWIFLFWLSCYELAKGTIFRFQKPPFLRVPHPPLSLRRLLFLPNMELLSCNRPPSHHPPFKQIHSHRPVFSNGNLRFLPFLAFSGNQSSFTNSSLRPLSPFLKFFFVRSTFPGILPSSTPSYSFFEAHDVESCRRFDNDLICENPDVCPAPSPMD